MSGAEEYARWVLDPSNERETGRLIKLAAKRFIDDLLRTDIYFDEVEAVKMPNFGGRYCYQWEGEWRGVLVKFQNWQRFIFEQVFGWFRTNDKLRRFDDVFVEISKKNGKSTMCAVLMDFHIIADDRVKTPKVFTAANNEDQAKICVNMAGRIIEQSEDLKELVDDGTIRLFNYKDNITEIVHKEKDGFIKAFAKETSDKNSKTAGGKHGVNASLGVVDEFGMSADHGASKPIKTSMASRAEGLMFYITTAGFNLNGPCYTELRRVGIMVLEGTIKKDNYLPIIYEIDLPKGPDGKEMDITPKALLENEWVWKHSNPNIDISVKRKFLRSMLEDAITYGSTTEVDVKTLNFNIWCESAEVWVPQETWNNNNFGITEADLIGRDCFTGYDFAARIDICAVAAIFPNVKQVNGKDIHAIKWWFWMPQARVRSNKERMDYSKWVQEGLIEVIPGDTIEWEYIITKMQNELPKYNHYSGAYDPYLATNGVIQGLTKEGIVLNPISQGFASISEPTKEWERLLTSCQIDHMNNPVAAWMNKNTTIIRDANRNIKIQKIDGEKGALKIDGIAAAINALAQMMSTPEDNDKMISSW